MTTKYAENYSKNYGKYFATLLLVLCLTVALNACEEWRGKHEAPRGAGTALILIDLQWDYLQAEGARPVSQTQVEPLIKAVNQMVAAANSNAVPNAGANRALGPRDEMPTIPITLARNRIAAAESPKPCAACLT